MGESDDDEKFEKSLTVVKNATDLQRLKIEKLMKNPEKLAFIPDRPKDKKFSDPAEFVRNVMGSSAGAGSGEFHVYRHIRRREYARQEFLTNIKNKDEKDFEYHLEIERKGKEDEDKTSKKRNKRQRQKEKLKAKRQKLKEMKKNGITTKDDSSSSSEELTESEEEGEPEKQPMESSNPENIPENITENKNEENKNEENKNEENENEGEK